MEKVALIAIFTMGIFACAASCVRLRVSFLFWALPTKFTGRINLDSDIFATANGYEGLRIDYSNFHTKQGSFI